MFGRNHKKKYLRYTDSVDDDNNSEETENGKGNIDLIINKLEKKVNPGNIHSGNADVILKMISQNQETTRTTKNNDSLINNISNLLPKNVQEKDNNEISQDIGNSIISTNSIQKGIRVSQKPAIEVDVSLNNVLKDELESQGENGVNKINIILSTNNTNSNFNNNTNNLLSRNKVLNMNDNNNNLSTLSQHLDNSRYFLNKKNNGLITASKIEKEKKEKYDEEKNNKEKDKNKNIKATINEKDEKIEKEKNKKIVKKMNRYRYNSLWSDCFDKRKWKRRCRNCSIITIIRDIFITIIVISALAFYATIFILG